MHELKNVVLVLTFIRHQNNHSHSLGGTELLYCVQGLIQGETSRAVDDLRASSERGESTMLIVPAFEVADDIKIPRTKLKALELLQEDKMSSFHIRHFPQVKQSKLHLAMHIATGVSGLSDIRDFNSAIFGLIVEALFLAIMYKSGIEYARVVGMHTIAQQLKVEA